MFIAAELKGVESSELTIRGGPAQVLMGRP